MDRRTWQAQLFVVSKPGARFLSWRSKTLEHKVTSKHEPKPPWLNEALNHVLKSRWRRTTYFSV